MVEWNGMEWNGIIPNVTYHFQYQTKVQYRLFYVCIIICVFDALQYEILFRAY